MAAAAPTNPLFPFVFVGCWNQPGASEADDAATPRDAVAAAVTALADIKHIVLGGDNVYPRPMPLADGKKNKKHEPAVFDDGLKLYRASGKSIIGSFGNHNIDTLGHQMGAFELTNTYYERIFDGNIHLVVLDTNIMTDAAMLAWFTETVTRLPADHFYFVVQHEPYFVARQTKFVELADADPFLNVMFARPPIAILCADTHNFQHDTIQQVGDDSTPNSDAPLLHQIIVGTGGANPDAYREGFTQEVRRGRYLFRQLLAIPGFGFLHIDNPGPSEYQCLFKKVMDWPAQQGGRRRRTIRSRRSRRTRRQK
jgi:hypothetical protein